MKRHFFTLFLLFFTCLIGYGQTNVTFSVDMSDVTVDPEGVRLAGEPTGWADTLLTDNGDGTWSITLALTAGETLLYKFKNGPDGWENQPGSCKVGNDNNRSLTVPSMEVALDTVCFDACNPCGQVGVTFHVDMSEETVDTAGVFLAGTFNNYSNQPMTDNGDGTWSASTVVMAGDTVTYKFKNGTDGWESLSGSDCTTGDFSNDRLLAVGDSDMEVGPVCFGSCDPCVTGSGPVNVTFSVDMNNETVDTNGVLISGTLNGWNGTPMTDNGNGTWSITLELNGGDTVYYKFRNGPDIWENEPGPCTIGNDNNRYLVVPGSDAVQDTVCFNSCFACGLISVTVTVDMLFETVDDEGVFIAGPFNGWSNTALWDNGDGTWTGGFGAEPGDTVQYKFKNGPDGWESLMEGDCTADDGQGGFNRIAPSMTDTVLAAACFTMCDPCMVLSEVDITFRVDMTEQTVHADGVFLAGSFNNFTDTAMVNMGDSIWALTLTFAPGDSITYKFKNGPDGWESIPGMDCTDGSFSNNRILVAPNFHETLDAVCFGKCGICFDPYSVTSASLINSCMNADGTVTIVFDEALNCESAEGDLAGMAEIGFHSGVTFISTGDQWQEVKDWDETGALNAINDGNDVFSVTFDPATYYAVDASDIQKFDMVFNQGPVDPDDAWASAGRDADLNENDDCDDLRVYVDQMPSCDNDPTETSSIALKDAGSCYDPTLGLVKVRFDDAQNCPNAPGELAGMTEVGFHSGANSWANGVDWDAPTAMTAVNDGNDVFEVVLDPVTYYSLASFGDLQNINMVFNQGATVPDSPWDSKGEDFDADNNCMDLLFAVSDLPTCDLTNIIDRELENSLIAIPNPFGDKTLVTFSNPNQEMYEVNLLTLTGQQIRTFRGVNGTTLEIERNDMPPGMYFLNFRNEEGKAATLKLVAK